MGGGGAPPHPPRLGHHGHLLPLGAPPPQVVAPPHLTFEIFNKNQIRGGGFALAAGSDKSGLSHWIGEFNVSMVEW